MESESKNLRVEKEKIVNGSMEECWKVLTDFSRETEYWPNIRKIRVIRETGNSIEREAVVGPPAFGAKTRQTLTLDSPHTMLVKFEGDGLKGFRDIRLIEIESGRTKISVLWELEFGSIPGFVLNIIKSQIIKTTESALTRINEFLIKTRSREGE